MRGVERGGLDRLVLNTIDNHHECNPIDKLWHSVPSKKALDESLPAGTASAIMEGRFYEVLTAALLEGRLPKREEVVYYSEGMDGIPDVIVDKANLLVESKATHVHRACEISGSQVEAYEVMSNKEPHPNILYAMWRHRIPGIKSLWQGSTKDLIKEAADSTLYGLLLPFEVIQEFARTRGSYDGLVYTHPEDHPRGNEYNGATAIRARTLTNLFEHPKIVMEELGFTTTKVDRMLTPRGLRIERFKIPVIPVVRVYVSKDEEATDDVPF